MKKFRLLMYASIILVMSGCSQDYSFEDSDENITQINSDRISELIGHVIGSSKSWNDCISSFSMHFGYIDRLLKDY